MAPHKGETAGVPLGECYERAVGRTDRRRDDVEGVWHSYDVWLTPALSRAERSEGMHGEASRRRARRLERVVGRQRTDLSCHDLYLHLTHP